MRRKRIVLIVILICLTAVAGVAVKFLLIPTGVIPNDYGKAELLYVIMDGVKYDFKDGFPTDDQAEELAKLLRSYKMRQTMDRASDGDYYSPKLYVAMRFKDKSGVVFKTVGVWINASNEVKVRTSPFMDLYCKVQDDGELFNEIMSVFKKD